MWNASLYERDFHAWANEQAALLRAGALASADVALEIESTGRTEKRELISRLAVLLTDLLKWEFQPALRGKSWRATIKVQRRELARLKSKLDEAIAYAYGDAILKASRETGLDEESFPASCRWSPG